MRNLLSLIFLFILPTIVFSQSTKKPLDFSVYDGWRSVSNREIANDGQWISYELLPYKGNATLELYDVKNAQKTIFEHGRYAQFSSNSNYLAYRIKPDVDSLRQLKLDKVKKDKLPKDTLAIYVLASKEKIYFPKLKSYELADENSDWLIYHFTAEKKKKAEEDSTSVKKSEKKSKKAKVKDKKAPKTSSFSIYNPISKVKHDFEKITESDISKNGALVAFVKLQNDTIVRSTVYVFDIKKQQLDSVFQTDGLVKKLKVDHNGNQIAFIFSADTIKEKRYSMYFWSKKTGKSVKIADTTNIELPNKWTVSENGKVFFSDDDKRLFFGSALRPLPEPKDTLLKAEKVVVDIWTWTDALLQPQQKANLKKEKKRTYLTEYLIDKQKLILLANEKVANVSVGYKASQNYFLAHTNLPYQKISSWESPSKRDYYQVNANTGQRKLALKGQQGWVHLSPMGDKILYFNYEESSWYIKNLSTNAAQNITSKLNTAFYNEEHDYPALAGSYGMMAWAKNGKFVLLYDRYDIWKINMDKSYSAVNLTNNYGRNNSIRLHYMRLDPDEEYVSANETVYLDGFNEKTKEDGYYSLKLNAANTPKEIYKGDFRLNAWVKAKNSSTVIFQQQTVTEFPDLWISNVDFNNPKKISKANPQQEEYIWTNVELVKWVTTEGTIEEGLLYKPENFDPNKKYPMMVYFYRLNSDNIHRHYSPSPSRSIINPTFYASNGYLVFIPNIRYKEGYPGMSSYNYVVGGTTALLNTRPYIDKDRLAIQGQSWGGYQVAYIVTQTDMFAAASAGAPVSNMTSAYGGIRWQSGMSRMFQYEKTQSRIGGTLWEKPLHYIENSPIFYVPKINTPLLIRHDDADGAVPWYQGIELFVAMRRLGKPAWFLNYNGEPHNLKSNSPARKDLSIRMMQFFDVYLKDADVPVWMSEGVPAIKKGKTLGYELVPKK